MNNTNAGAMTVAQLFQECEENLRAYLLQLRSDHGIDFDLAQLYLPSAKKCTDHLNERLKKVTAEFNEQVKKRHRKRIVNIKQEPVIDLSADEEAETKHSEEKANGKRKSQRTLKKPSRFI